MKYSVSNVHTVDFSPYTKLYETFPSSAVVAVAEIYDLASPFKKYT